jgi:photosystem II stability/assembly factor-like uncharacterized protein
MRYFFCFILIVLFLPIFSQAQQKQTFKVYKLDGGEIKCSVDAGASWEKLKLPFNNATAFNYDAKAPERILAGTTAMVYRSSNGGVTWHAVLAGSNTFTPQLFSVSQKNPFRMYCAGTTDNNNTWTTEVYQSMDGGVNWHRVMITKEPIETLHIDPDSPSQKILFSGTQTKGGK